MPLLRLPIWQSFVLVLALVLLSSPISAKNTRILVFGDSLSSAYNMPIEKGWVRLLQRHLSDQTIAATIVNASISGETSTGGLARFAKELRLSKPDIVILQLGANDGLRGSSLAQLEKNLATMISLSLKRKIKVLLAGIHIPPNYGRTYTKTFDQVYVTLARDYPVTFIPFLLVDVATKPEMIQSDGLHPNETAQPVIVNNILPFVLALLDD
ncbi:MAG: arylesterase [Enterobacterales bacterium]|nr:arylesterase [Enterobacterales bacterium]